MEAEQTGFHPHYKFRHGDYASCIVVHFPSILQFAPTKFQHQKSKINLEQVKKAQIYICTYASYAKTNASYAKTKKSRLTIMQLAQCKTFVVAK